MIFFDSFCYLTKFKTKQQKPQISGGLPWCPSAAAEQTLQRWCTGGRIRPTIAAPEPRSAGGPAAATLSFWGTTAGPSNLVSSQNTGIVKIAVVRELMPDRDSYITSRASEIARFPSVRPVKRNLLNRSWCCLWKQENHVCGFCGCLGGWSDLTGCIFRGINLAKCNL